MNQNQCCSCFCFVFFLMNSLIILLFCSLCLRLIRKRLLWQLSNQTSRQIKKITGEETYKTTARPSFKEMFLIKMFAPALRCFYLVKLQ